MADKLMRAQVTIPLDSGVPEDAIVNTLYFDGDDFPGATDVWYYDGVEILVRDFFQAIDGFIYPPTVGPLATTKIYDMRDPEPRVPGRVATFALTPRVDGTDIAFPSEVALCASFAAAHPSGVSPARRRGRIFLGPISGGCGEIVNSQNRPTSEVLDAVRDAMNTMSNGYNAGAPADSSIRWSIYSPKTDETSSLDDAFNDVLSGWVDDAWDTQRRRGAKPLSRVTFS